MTKRKSTKRALLLSALSLLMCVSMLIGSTFAWFTDSVTSGNNIIKSGNLDVELEYKKVVDGKVSTEWTSVKDKTDIFNPKALWEPGHVEVVYLKVSNLGTLALKYQLGVNVIKETLGKTETGADIKLSEHLVFKTLLIEESDVGAYNTREAAKTAAGTVKGLKDYNGKTTALDAKGGANAEDYVALIVYMPETVGNEANYRGTDIPTIELGINLFATQFTAEKDSFDKFYDENAWHNAMKVATADELNKAIANAKDGDVIVFADDIESVDGTVITDKKITIDLNGNTFAVSEGASTNNRNFKIDGASVVTIQNGTLVADGDTNSGAFGTIRTEGTANVTLSNLKLYNYRGNGLNVKALAGTTVTVNNCVINATNGGGVEAAGGTVILNNTTITQTGAFDWCSAAIGVNSDGKVVVNSGNYTANTAGTWAAYVMNSGGTLEINGGNFTGANASGIICADRAAVVNINNGNFNSTGAILNMCNNLGTMPNPVATIAGGTFSANPTVSGGWDGGISLADGCRIADNGDGTYIILPDVGADLTAVAGHPGVYKSTGENYYVATPDALVDVFSTIIPVNMERAQSVSLLADMDMSGRIWEPLNNQHVTINGYNHTISNITCKEGSKSGLFGYAGGVAINDLTLKNVTSKGSQAGIFAGLATGLKLNNCFVEGDNTVTYYKTAETWNGIGAITGVCTESASTLNVTIKEGTTVALTKGDMVTESACVFNDLFGGYLLKYQGTVVNNGQIATGVATTAGLIDAVKNAPVGSETTVVMADGTYAGNIDITVAALGAAGGDIVIKAAEGAKPVITGTVTIGYREQNVGAASYQAKVTFDGITFDHAEAGKHCLNVQDVESFYMVNCTVVGDGEYGFSTPGSNGTGAAKIEKCKFVNAGLQLAGKFAQTLVIDDCEFEESVVNVQGGAPLGPTIQNSEFDITLTAAHNGGSFYVIRNSNAGANIKVQNCDIHVDAEQGFTGVAGTNGWGVFVDKATNAVTMNVTDVRITMTDAALAQTALNLTKIVDANGEIILNEVKVNGVVQ